MPVINGVRCGSDHHWAVLDETFVSRLLVACASASRSTAPLAYIAKQYGISPQHLHQIWANHSWRHVPGPRRARYMPRMTAYDLGLV
jgi:hypothetical protein